MLVRRSILIEDKSKDVNISLPDGSVMRFDGRLIASSWDEDGEESGARFSGEIGRFNIYRIYSTTDDKYGCVHEKISRWTGEMTQTRAILCSTTEEISEFFGSGWLAQELYVKANISV